MIINFEDYITRYGFHLTPIKPNSKAPFLDDWGNNGVTTIEGLKQYPNNGFGVILAHTDICSIDIDDEQSFMLICDSLGITIPEYVPTIKGNPNRRKLMFRLPKDLPPITKKHISFVSGVVFELRGSNDGTFLQDILPPSIHPDTQQPYVWFIEPPIELGAWPYLPQEWIDTWLDWGEFKSLALALDPNKRAELPIATTRTFRVGDVPEVINAFNTANPLTETLQKYGYKKISKDKWISPQSSSKLAGVKVFGDSCYSHHASDGELCGVICDAFELYSYYEHGHDKKLATKVAAKELGIKSRKHKGPADIIQGPKPLKFFPTRKI